MLARALPVFVAAWLAGASFIAHGADPVERSPDSYVELSGSMTGLGYFAGEIKGSLYNSHPTKSIRVTEITVSSSAGRRVLRDNYVVGPQQIVKVRLETGLHLNFKDKDWWTWRVTRANWHLGGSAPSKGTE